MLAKLFVYSIYITVLGTKKWSKLQLDGFAFSCITLICMIIIHIRMNMVWFARRCLMQSWGVGFLEETNLEFVIVSWSNAGIKGVSITTSLVWAALIQNKGQKEVCSCCLSHHFCCLPPWTVAHPQCATISCLWIKTMSSVNFSFFNLGCQQWVKSKTKPLCCTTSKSYSAI